ISPDGSLAATGGFNGELQIWDLKTGATERVLRGKGAPNWAVAFSADGQRIAWGTTWQSAPDRQSHTSEATSPLLFQLQLPTSSTSLGRPEPITEAPAKNFVRARRSILDYALSHSKGGNYGYDAVLDLKQGDKVLASIERGSTDGYQHRAYTF